MITAELNVKNEIYTRCFRADEKKKKPLKGTETRIKAQLKVIWLERPGLR
jgi:hypothetical protein